MSQHYDSIMEFLRFREKSNFVSVVEHRSIAGGIFMQTWNATKNAYALTEDPPPKMDVADTLAACRERGLTETVTIALFPELNDLIALVHRFIETVPDPQPWSYVSGYGTMYFVFASAADAVTFRMLI